MNIKITHTTVWLPAMLFFFSQLGTTTAQPIDKNHSRTIFKIGKLLDLNKISATKFDSNSEEWAWNFLFAEENLKKKITPKSANGLTLFTFTYNQRTNLRKGQIKKAKANIRKDKALDIVLTQLERNLHFFDKKLDVINVEGKLFYILYFPSESEKI